MTEPSKLLLKLSRQLFADAIERDKFIEALTNPQPFYPAILWCREQPENWPFTIEPATSWQPKFVDRLSLDAKPGKHPYHQAGYFYCLDFSSVFAATVLLAIQKPVNLVFDICASPGGKSIFAWQALRPNLLISNEAIGKRLGMLHSNLKRCQIQPAVLLNLDSSILAKEFARTSDLAIVDAPCSGQSLLAKGGKAPGCFHPATINQNANRQKRILANSAQVVAPQGYLAYMTCTYSIEENERVCEWFLKKFPQFRTVEIDRLADYRSDLTALNCYRMFPQSRLGAGAFTVLFQNTEDGATNRLPDGLMEKAIAIFERESDR
ncbi:MAG: RsmB/NOP family class I SAM-dependent RNA methyltransferase [Cyanosarcina radialis HA8281-LM2]|jgi:16S rRNA C967 or C1407 C5-methylase (RsmB/RsmF family)|nr:RsmB/NOP family class I SAM-dependent RNA methyltransferase [Cyanosarcina radialis HA8281-LM2]